MQYALAPISHFGAISACPVCIALAHILILALQARASVRLHTRRVESSISAFVLCAFSALGTSALSFLCAFSALGKALFASLRVQRSGPGPFFSAPSALWARPFLLCAFSAFLICACCACLVRIALALWVSLGDPLRVLRVPRAYRTCTVGFVGGPFAGDPTTRVPSRGPLSEIIGMSRQAMATSLWSKQSNLTSEI